jgi:DNA-directed RNA polymerase subunit RPC12/RpoP
MKKGLIFGLLLLLIGFLFWVMVISQLSNPVQDIAVKMDKENFEWFTCPSCAKLFMAEATAKKGSCPYCGFTMMLGVEQKRVLATSVDKSQFASFLCPACNKLFFAYKTGETGRCPYCGEPILLAAPATVSPEDTLPAALVFVKDYGGMIFLAMIVLGVLAAVGIYLMLQNRVILSLEPVGGALRDKQKIELLKRQIKKKHLTLGASASDDIKINHPSLKNFKCTLSFVRVGGNTHAYLKRDVNEPIWVNNKPEYNVQLKNRDKIKLGDIVFEVHENRN